MDFSDSPTQVALATLISLVVLVEARYVQNNKCMYIDEKRNDCMLVQPHLNESDGTLGRSVIRFARSFALYTVHPTGMHQ